MEEKLDDAEIDKLRAVVGIGSETDDYFGDGSNNSSLIKKSAAFEAQRNMSKNNASKNLEKPIVPAPQSLDTELFVKVEEHAAIGEKLIEAKSDMKVIADTISLLAKAEKLKTEAISRMDTAIGKIDSDIEAVESKLVAPEGLNAPEIEMGMGSGFVSDNLLDLRSELDALKSELSKINK